MYFFNIARHSFDTSSIVYSVTMEMYSVGLAGVKMIKGVASGRYLAMNKYGNVYTTVRT